MSEIHPLVVRLLREFRGRRQRLLLWRSAAIAAITLVFAMSAVAVVDYLWLLADSVRWGLSAAAYVAVAAAAWFGGLRALWQATDDREIAKRIEAVMPEMRQDLLSAVELGQAADEMSGGAPLFRRLIQEDVAGRVGGMAAAALLPPELIRRWLWGAGALLAFCLLIAALPGSPVGALLLRACAPMANLDRISAVKIAILLPKPAETRAAIGDVLPVLVKLDGAEASEAYLECFEAEG
ncbi:MAG: hypothetical protein N3A66_05820 [Planctomycetota bacterium]|nr:hypothetical protein [Planctomycetota bacterium]